MNTTHATHATSASTADDALALAQAALAVFEANDNEDAPPTHYAGVLLLRQAVDALRVAGAH